MDSERRNVDPMDPHWTPGPGETWPELEQLRAISDAARRPDLVDDHDQS